MVSAFSVPKSKRQQKYDKNPGPGQYNPQTSPKIVKKSDPNYSFGKLQRRQNASFVPGPGSYEPKSNLTNGKDPSYSMLGRKDNYSNANNVGPGQYEPKNQYSKDKSPSYSLYGRSKSVLDNGVPGAGQYQIKGENQIQKRHGIRFSKDKRDSFDKRNIPGPGSYQYQNAVFKYGSKVDPSYGFGSRLKALQILDVPGPGSYDGKYENYSKISGIMSRQLRGANYDNRTPGPGNYGQSSSTVLKKFPSWSMSKSTRIIDQKTIDLGPGQYQHDKNYTSIMNSSPNYKFSHDKRGKGYQTNVPGPGSYEQNLLGSRKNIRIGQKLKDTEGLKVPGPGTYEAGKYDNQSWLKGSGRYSLGKSSRDNLGGSKIPGPGTYQPTNQDPKGKVTFSKDTRLKANNNPNPGPGQYDLKPTFADVPKYLLPNK